MKLAGRAVNTLRMTNTMAIPAMFQERLPWFGWCAGSKESIARLAPVDSIIDILTSFFIIGRRLRYVSDIVNSCCLDRVNPTVSSSTISPCPHKVSAGRV